MRGLFMFIDDLIEKNLHLLKFNIKDAIVFKIDEQSRDFTANHDPIHKINSKLPYDNMVLLLNDKLFWFLQGEGDGLVNIHAIEIYKEFAHAVIIDSQPIFITYLPFTKLNDAELAPLNTFRTWTSLPEKHHLFGKVKAVLDEERMKLFVHDALFPLRQFTDILSCKNIKSHLICPDDAIQQKRKKKGKLPLVSFYTLLIRPLTTKGRIEMERQWSNRVHLCRGHKRTYKNTAPLFGKHIGSFWIPPHARGSKYKGLIVKDYKLNPREDS